MNEVQLDDDSMFTWEKDAEDEGDEYIEYSDTSYYVYASSRAEYLDKAREELNSLNKTINNIVLTMKFVEYPETFDKYLSEEKERRLHMEIENKRREILKLQSELDKLEK